MPPSINNRYRELEAEARRLGVKLDSRNSNERLAERILEAHAASEGKG
jgi:hypothetical protein